MAHDFPHMISINPFNLATLMRDLKLKPSTDFGDEWFAGAEFMRQDLIFKVSHFLQDASLDYSADDFKAIAL